MFHIPSPFLLFEVVTLDTLDRDGVFRILVFWSVLTAAHQACLCPLMLVL